MGLAAGAGAMLGPLAADGASELPLITKPIPSSGERLPVIGLGTNRYSVTSAQDLAERKEVLQRMPQLGGKLVDTAPAYGRSEEVIGELVAQIGNRDKLFYATKVTAPGGDVSAGRAMLDSSFRRLRTDRIELIQVHNLDGTDTMIPVLLELRKAGKIKYVGVTTSQDQQHEELANAMRRYKLDFVQLNYSLDDRESAATLLPLAQDRGIAVLANLPLGGRRGSLFSRVGSRPLPEWAADIDATSWGQIFLKYVVSHPAVTCAIPGTTKLTHLEDNQRAARGRLPDAQLRKRMEQFWSSLDGA
jgi:aryl-alcohol dehydrogenase-like predicted oxidoreductase